MRPSKKEPAAQHRDEPGGASCARGHGKHAAAPKALAFVFRGHGTHVEAFVADRRDEALPGAHGVHTDAPCAAQVPAGHGAHAERAVAPSTDDAEPAKQGEHETAPAGANAPSGQHTAAPLLL